MYYTYLHCKPSGEPFYVGKGADKWTSGHGTDRRSHSKKNRNQYHRNITAKYGWENILIYIFPCVSEAEALADEVQQIAQLRAAGYELANLTAGGEGCSGMVVTAETRSRISAALQGRKRPPRSAEWKAKLSTANKGKPPSEAAKQAASARNKGRVHSAETRAKFSLAQTGRKHAPRTEEWRLKQQASKIGKPWSEARRAACNKRKTSI